jgi:chaperone BCS1
MSLFFYFVNIIFSHLRPPALSLARAGRGGWIDQYRLGTFDHAGGASGPAASRDTALRFYPGAGSHLVFVGLCPVLISRHTEGPGPGSGGSGGGGLPASRSGALGRETLRITVPLGTIAWVERIVRRAQALARAREASMTSVYTGDQYGNWRRSGCRPARSVASVILEPGLPEAIIDDARGFLARERWYIERGIPYRRGYLFHGPPGSGKTSFISALAGELALDIYAVNLGNASITDEILAELLAETPSRCIVLLEDIDAAVGTDDESSGSNSTAAVSASASSSASASASSDGSDAGDGAAPGMMRGGASVTYSGLLNTLDGVAAKEGRILILTTNHPERIPQSLVRDGRVDIRRRFGWATPEQAARLLRRFYSSTGAGDEAGDISVESSGGGGGGGGDNAAGNTSINNTATDPVIESAAAAIAERVASCGRNVSMAEVQGALMRFKDDPRLAAEHLASEV